MRRIFESQSRSVAESWPHYVAYDLGRVIRQIADGAGAAAHALDSASTLLRTVGQRLSPRRRAPKDPRVQVTVDPRARARGEHLPASIAIALGEDGQPQVAWRSSVETFEELGRDALSVLGTIQEGADTPFFAIVNRSQEGWAELRMLADASGLTAALQKARLAALRHDHDPVLARLADRLESLGEPERREMGQRLLERLTSQPALRQLASSSGFRPVELRPAELERLGLAAASSARTTLHELGLTDADIAHVSSVAAEVVAPLVELTELYLAPRTPMDRVKRYFRLQRVGFTALRIASRPSFHVDSWPAPALNGARRPGRKHLAEQ